MLIIALEFILQKRVKFRLLSFIHPNLGSSVFVAKGRFCVAAYGQIKVDTAENRGEGKGEFPIGPDLIVTGEMEGPRLQGKNTFVAVGDKGCLKLVHVRLLNSYEYVYQYI